MNRIHGRPDEDIFVAVFGLSLFKAMDAFELLRLAGVAPPPAAHIRWIRRWAVCQRRGRRGYRRRRSADDRFLDTSLCRDLIEFEVRPCRFVVLHGLGLAMTCWHTCCVQVCPWFTDHLQGLNSNRQMCSCSKTIAFVGLCKPSPLMLS